MKATLTTWLILLPIVLSGAASADVLTAVLEPPSVYIPVALELGGTVTGATEVAVRIQGYSGGAHFFCEDMGGDWDVWQPWDVHVTLDGCSEAVIRVPLQQEYDETGLVLLDHAVTDWSHFQDGVVMVEVGYGSNWESWDCYAAGSEDLTMARLELIITADGVVPAEATAWSAVKAIYR